nr:histone deacetylase 14 [Tanacetum cinerariifolium]
WNTLTQEAKTGVYRFYLDEDWFILNASLLREALEITPIDQAHQFKSPPSGDAIIDFVNALDYPEEIHFVSRMAVNNLYQPWKAILSMINQCLTSKTFEDDHRLGNLKFVAKGEEDDVFGMQIPKEMIIENIRNAPYYNAYLEMVAKHDHNIAAEEGGKKKLASKSDQSKKLATAKQPKPVSSNQSKPVPAKQPKHVKEKSTKPSLVKKAGKGKVRKVRKGKSSLQLVDEEEQAQPEPEPQGKGKGIVTDEQVAKSLLELQKPKKTNVANKVDLEEKTAKIDQGQAGSDPGKTPESRPPPKRVLMEEDQAGPNPRQSHVALAGPDPKPMHDDFIATLYPHVHESLKHPDEEHVHLENPLSSTRTLSSMKNLDSFTFGDQFIADKSPEDEPRNANMETKVKSMVTVPIHQALSSVPPLSTPVINLIPPKPVSSTVQEPVFTATTETTTTLPPPPPQQQSTPDPAL